MEIESLTGVVTVTEALEKGRLKHVDLHWKQVEFHISCFKKNKI